MQEESEACNESENSNSEMILLPQNSHLEVLISDDEQGESDSRLVYEQKLSRKLADLGFEEEGMTIQQKEELLAVVLASWETAEEEKTRRRLNEQFDVSSEAFHQDGVAVSTDDSLFFSGSVQTVSSVECGSTSALITLSEDFIPTGSNQMVSYSPVELCESESMLSKFQYGDEPSASCQSGNSVKPQPLQRTRSKKNYGKELGAETGTHSKFHHSMTKQRLHLENCMSMWKPCLSPQDTPLVRTRKEGEDTDLSHSDNEESNVKMNAFIQEFDFALSTVKKAVPRKIQFGKPYHFSRHGLYSKRSNRPDKYDLVVGTCEKTISDQKVASNFPENPSMIHKTEPFSRTANNVYRYEDSNVTNRNTYMATRSGGRYSRKNSAKTLPKKSMEEKNALIDHPADQNAFEDTDTPALTEKDVEVILEERLPQFSELKKESAEVNSDCNDFGSCAQQMDGFNACSSSKDAKDLKIANSSSKASDTSEGSSEIDVETIVDEEIEEFVLKRKLIQENHVNSKQCKTNQSKRLKKTAS